MSTGWTNERRKKQSEAIRAWKPWKGSVGQTSREGKSRAAKNSYKHGARSQLTIELKNILSEIDSIQSDLEKRSS